jgi:iron-sulfur cluster insertion protein
MQTVSEAHSNTPVFSANLTAEDLRLTPAARSKMAELFADLEDDIAGIRVFVTGGGCAGMTYGMTFTDQRTEYDSVLKEEGFDVFVDSVALNFLRGVEVDFVDRGMGSASFVFNNVFAATGGSGTCGACGAVGGGCA